MCEFNADNDFVKTSPPFDTSSALGGPYNCNTSYKTAFWSDNFDCM